MNWLKKINVGGRATTKPELPPGLRVYAIGDVHGRYDLLEKLHAIIGQDLIDFPVEESTEIFLGDYVDRGPQSRAVIEHLCKTPTNCDRRVCLKGNHENILLDFLDAPEVLEHWRDLGGLETLYSYDVQPPRTRDIDQAMACRDQFLRALPEAHLDFLRTLPLYIALGSYLFVHAGIRPSRALEEQEEQDLMWIRGPFLDSRKDHGFVVVHGHTPQQDYEVLPNRINVDTWAYLSGRLTCVVLEGDNKRFIQVSI